MNAPRALTLAAAFLLAAVASPQSHSAQDSGTPANEKERRLNSIDDAARSAYQVAMQSYRDDVDAKPYDVMLAVERCEFLDELQARFYEVAPSWIDAIADESERCTAELTERFPDHPEVLLRDLAQQYGAEAVTAGRQITKRDLSLWTRAQVSRLATLLAQAYDVQGDRAAKEQALYALRTDMHSDVRLIAARWHIRDRESEAARAILVSPFDTHGSGNTHYLIEKIQLLAEIDARDDVLAIYKQFTDAERPSYGRLKVVNALMAVDAIDAARSELNEARDDQYAAEGIEFRRFLLEFHHGTPQAALAAYNVLRDSGYDADPILQYRASLVARDATLPWQLRDLAGLATALLVFGLIGAAPLLLLGAVHYRGIVRAQQGKCVVPPIATWSLPSAWYALAAIVCGQLLAIYFIGPLEFSGLGWSWDSLLENRKQLSQAMIAASIVELLLAIPLLYRAHENRLLLATHYAPVKAALIGAGMGLAFRAPTIVALLLSSDSMPLQHATNETVRILLDIQQRYGLLPVFAVAVVVAPLVEELVFRGVLLGALAKHIRFGWANVIQAALFAGLHVEPVTLPLLFIFGLVNGVLAKRSGGLLASIVLHAVFNAVLFAVFFTDG